MNGLVLCNIIGAGNGRNVISQEEEEKIKIISSDRIDCIYLTNDFCCQSSHTRLIVWLFVYHST